MTLALHLACVIVIALRWALSQATSENNADRSEKVHIRILQIVIMNGFEMLSRDDIPILDPFWMVGGYRQ